MSTTPGRLHGSHDRRLFVAAALGILLIVFSGFARSYFLKGLFGTPPLSLLVHVHGAVMTSWFVLFLVQACLIETRRVALHRRIGVFGAALAVAILLLGPYVAFRAAAREVHAHTRAAEFFLLILGYDCLIVTLFAGFVAWAIAWRRRGDFHKRLMLLATLSLLTPAIGRLPFWSGNLQIVLAGDLCVLLCVAADVWLTSPPASGIRGRRTPDRHHHLSRSCRRECARLDAIRPATRRLTAARAAMHG